MAGTIDPVVNKLILLLEKEANLLGGVNREITTITDELKRIMVVLNEADRRVDFEANDVSDGVRVWVEDLRAVALEIENAIDEYTHLMAQQQHSGNRRFIRFFRKVFCLITQFKQRHNLASKVKELKNSVKEISDRRARYGFNESSTVSSQDNTWYDVRKDAHFLNETKVIGFDGDRDNLVKVLEGGSPKRTVVSMVGMGGLGKTTLARQVYNRVKGSFDCFAWIDVSQSYNALALLKKLIKKLRESRKEHVPQEIDTIDETIMIETLKDYLTGKSYVIFFDDVWKESFWAEVQNALPEDDAKAGRAVITTRLVNVANNCKRSAFVHIHQLQPLPLEKSWELFCQTTFHVFGGLCPNQLEELSWLIVARCQGLPLAIVVIAGLLSTKNNDVMEWRIFLSSLSSELERNDQLSSITKILSFSYYELPHHLKSCFLYCGIFPEDYSISCRRLIRQWIAEGFVCTKKNTDVEFIAKDYLVELINRSLIQVSKRGLDGKPKTCHLHDLYRDMIIKKMDYLCFYKDLSRDCLSLRGLTRRVSIGSHSNDALKNFNEASHARSVFVLDNELTPNQQILTVTCFKFLRLLDFEDSPRLECIPEDIGKLFHLRYLSVRGTKVAFLPKSIGNLANLETLDLKNTLVKELPAEINKLGKLRHLLVYCCDRSVDWSINSLSGAKMKKGFGRLKSLQKLYYIDANVVEFDLFNEIFQLTNLTRLVIKKLKAEDGKSLCICIQKMEHLESLGIASTNEDEPIDLESMSSPPECLQRLILNGRLLKFPEWIAKLRYLVKIQIAWSKLEDDPLKFLQKLPSLLDITITKYAFNGEKLQFEKESFPKLKKLSLHYLSRCNSVIIKEGALSNLEELSIGSCPQLMHIEFKHKLPKLKSMYIWKMPPQFNYNFSTLKLKKSVR